MAFQRLLREGCNCYGHLAAARCRPCTTNLPTSLFERWIARLRRPRLKAGITRGLPAALPLAAALGGDLADSSTEGVWRLAEGQATGTLPSDLNALAIYEGRLKESRTWPYNTAMLRTLALSGLVPLVPVIGRLVVENVLK